MQPQTLLLMVLVLSALCCASAENSSLPTCGKPTVAPDETEFTGGKEAVQHSWPWVVTIRLDNSSHQCSGSIVNESLVVTAAECVAKFSPSGTPASQVVEAGHHCRDCNEASVQRRVVDKVLIHPDFDSKYTEHDLALLRVSKVFEFNENVSPVCLPTQPVADSATCFVAGWGGIGNLTEHLFQARLSIVPNPVCNDSDHYGSGDISDNMLCARYDKEGVSSCIGDYGGPLVCKSAEAEAKGELWSLEGVMSAWDRCDDPLRPLVFTKVQEYVRWITENGIALTS